MKLTKKNVESLEPTGTRYEVRDDELIGFSIRVGATGEKVSTLLTEQEKAELRLSNAFASEHSLP